ncbi:MAG: SDR family NAD(P)-dependent oxidoreductase [Rectinema sp.]
MNVKVSSSSIAPVLRGLILAEASFSCMVKSRAEGQSCQNAPLRLVVEGILLDTEIDDAELQKALRKALMSLDLQSLRNRLRDREEVCLDLTDRGGSVLAQFSLIPLESLDIRHRLAIDVPGDERLLSSTARASVVKGKIAFVTGGAQGFGAEIARGLAQSGAVVWIADINLPAAQRFARQLSAEISEQPVFAVDIDVSNEASVQRAFDLVARTSGGLDIVVSNAGILKAGSVLDQPVKDFRLVNEVNYVGFFNVAQHAARLLRLQWLGDPDWYTDIIQINSKSGLEGSNKNSAYAGSKFGGIGLVQSFALELVEYHIKVNAICPGNFFDGPLWSDPQRGLFVQYLNSGKVPGATTLEDVRRFYEAKIPMKRGCYGPDVLRAIYYLVEQVYETGQALPVTGGQVMLH